MKKYLALILMLLCSCQAYAVKVNTLYQAELYVATQSPSLRLLAEKQGLSQVFLRLTGGREFENNPVIQDALEKAENYVQEFSYVTPDDHADQYKLTITYDTTDVNNLLRRADVSLWGNERPLLIVWVTTTKNNQTEIISNDADNAILNALKDQAQKYAVPLIFPVMDVSEIDVVKPQTIETFDVASLLKVSNPYSPDGYLIGNIVEKANNVYESQWQLLIHRERFQWSSNADSLDKMLDDSFQRVTQSIAKRNRLTKQNIQDIWVKLEVSNIMSRSDLVRLLSYLRRTHSVRHIQLSEVQGDVVRVAVLVHGDLASFISKAAIGGRLILRSQYEDANILIYEWVH